MDETVRLDVALVRRGLAKSRENAKEYIQHQAVTVNGIVQSKVSFKVSDDDILECHDRAAYVGRGGLKLEEAIRAFSVSLDHAVCLDAGASTGGFTDCMLKNGAVSVYAVEGGHGQLASTLCSDPRVFNYENTDIRRMPPEIIEKRFDFIAGDLSFISLKIVMPYLFPLLKENGCAVLLIKPQFEAGRSAIGKNGIVKSPRDHIRVLEEMIGSVHALGISVGGVIPSPIRGGSGNIEYLLYCGSGLSENFPDPASVVRTAFCLQA